jgi:ribosomal protein L11 methylase PrmA
MYAVILDDRVRRWGRRREGMLLVHERMHDDGSDEGAVCQALSSAPRLSRSQRVSWSGLLRSAKHHHHLMALSSTLVIESLSKEQIDRFIHEEQLDDADPLRHLRDQETDDLLPLVPAQPPSIHNETLHLTFQDITVTLKVDAGPGCGGIAWPAGEVLSQYIVRRGRDYWQGKRVLELGSGTGLVGLVAGYLGAQTVVTDQRSAPLLVLYILIRNRIITINT